MSSLENLPKPHEQTKHKMQRKRKAPAPVVVAAPSVDNVIAIKSKVKGRTSSAPQQQQPPASSTEASSVSIAIQFPAMNESSADAYNDTIDRILLNSESRQGPKNATIFESSSFGSKSPYKDSTGGKLTAEELNQLSVLSSTVDVSVRERGDSSNIDAACDTKKDNGHDFNWSCIDVDSVTQLIGLLEDHVKSALAIDLIREARQAHDQEDEEVSATYSISCVVLLFYSLYVG
jgi:hypothetical protein